MTAQRLRAVAWAVFVMLSMGCTGAGGTGAPAGTAATMSPFTTGAATAAASSAAVPSPGPTAGRPIAADAVIPIGFGSTPRVGPTGIWVPTDSGVLRIDPATNAIASTFDLGATSNNYLLAVDATDLWVDSFNADLLLRLDPVTGKQRASITTEAGPQYLVDLPGAIWVANHHAGSVSRIDPKTNRIVQSITVGPRGSGGPLSLTAVPGGLWVGFGDTMAVAHIDTKTGTVVATVPLPGGITGVIPVGDHLWAYYQGDNGSGIAVLNAAGDAVASTIDVGGVPGSGAWLHDGVVWLPVLPALNGPGIVVGIDPATNQLVDRLSIPDGTPSYIFDAFGSAWLLLDLQGKLERFPESDFTLPH